jgi:two-component system NtrC family sensor kinase
MNTRRLTRDRSGSSPRRPTLSPNNDPGLPLASLLAGAKRLTDVLPQLHQHALDVTGGSCSLLLENNPRNAVLQATSAYGLDELRTDPWQPLDKEAAILLDTFGHRVPTLIPELERQMPELAARLGTPVALLVPLVQGNDRVGLLAIGFADSPTADASPGAGHVADAFLATLELFRLRQNEALQRDVRELLEDFTDRVARSMSITTGLDAFCQGANRLFGADRTSVWIHDRRARHLVLEASSDVERGAQGMRISSDDPHAQAAAGLRRVRAELIPGTDDFDASTATVTVPLRGYRRALGAVVFEGVRVETGDELNLLDRADELGRQLSTAIENMQLLEDVIRSRRELENAFDSIAHLVVVVDRRGRIVHANEAFAARAGVLRDELFDRPLADCVGPELLAWFAELERAGQPVGAPPAVREIVDSALKGPLLVTVTDLFDQERARVGRVVVARDLTPESALEVEREALRKRLTQTEKLLALGQFVAGIAHELNNPLQSVLGHLELLRATGAFPKQLRRDIQTIFREADRAAKIVRNLLVFTGARRLIRRPVNLNALLQRVTASRQPACRAQNIEIVRHYDERLPRLKSDPLLLHQVFLNMVMNAEQAVSATGRPGRIEIRTAASGRDRVVVTIRDTGNGIPAEALPRVFEPFYTTKDVGKGTGLGLAIAYGIVQEHGGHIVAANHPDGGAVLTVELSCGSPA